MKKCISIALSTMLLLSAVLPGTLVSAASTEEITDQGSGIVWIDARAADPHYYTGITGFTISYKLIKGGAMGSEEEPFPVNGVMIAAGARTADEFGWDAEGALPTFVGPAQEIVLHITGDGSFIGTMLFSHGVDAGALAVGETATFTYEGTSALFTEEDSCLTAHGLFGTEVEILSVTWLRGEIVEPIDPGESRERVETVKYPDIATVSEDKQNGYNYVDITVPAGDGPFPVVLWIHGGSFTMLDRKSCFIPDTMQYLLAQGFAIVSVEYTLSTLSEEPPYLSGYPQMVYDVKAAIRFLRANAKEYKLDTGFIAAMGESAGAMLAMMVGTTNGSAAHEDLTMGNAALSGDVQAIVSYFGSGDLSLYFGEIGSPLHQMTADCPPLFLTHGRNDQAVPFIGSTQMEERALELIGADKVTTLYYDDAPHASKAAFDNRQTMSAVEGFLSKHLAAARAEGGSEGINPPEENPKTGDEAFEFFLIAIALSAMGIITLGITARKSRMRG